MDIFFIKEKLDLKIVDLPKIKSEDQLTDILTKAVSYQAYLSFLGKLGICDINLFTNLRGSVEFLESFKSMILFLFFVILFLILSFHSLIV